MPQIVDHIDRDTKNNSIENLREISRSHNRVNSDKLSGVKTKPNGKFQARIYYNKKYIHLGTFTSYEDAHQAYLNARKEYYKGVYNG